MADNYLFYGIFSIFIALSYSQQSNPNPIANNNGEQFSQPNPIELEGEPGTQRLKVSVTSPGLTLTDDVSGATANLPVFHDRMGDLNLGLNDNQASKNNETDVQKDLNSDGSMPKLFKGDRMGDIGTGVAIKPNIIGQTPPSPNTTQPGCEKEVLKSYEGRIAAFRRMDDMTYPTILNDLINLCSEMTSAQTDLKKYHQDCVAMNDQKVFNTFYEGFDKSVQYLCAPSKYRTQFIKESLCINETLTKVRNTTCRQGPDPLDPDKGLADPFRNVCQSNFNTFNCLVDALNATCSATTVEFFQCHVKMVLGQIFTSMCKTDFSITCKENIENETVQKSNSQEETVNDNISTTIRPLLNDHVHEPAKHVNGAVTIIPRAVLVFTALFIILH